jgi:GAF domain-containing protein
VIDDPARRRADAEMLRLLEEVYASNPAVQPIDAAAMIVARQIESLGADAGFVAAVSADGTAVEVARVTPHSSNPVRLAFPLDAPYPLAASLRTRQALYIADNQALDCDHPGLVRIKDVDHACATLPLFDTDGELLGAFNVSFEDPHEFTDEERTAIEQLAARCAAAMSRSRPA